MRDTTYSLSPFSPKISLELLRVHIVFLRIEEYIEYIQVVVITLVRNKWAMVSRKLEIIGAEK